MIRLQNCSTVPDHWAEAIVQASSWPPHGTLLLLLGTDPYERECGRTVWFGHRAQSKGLEGLWTFGDWDCAVVVTSATTDMFETCPSFVAWIIGHELGHAIIALREPDVHGICLFVQEHIRTASRGAVSSWLDLPHEELCDRFGRHVAETVVGEKRFRSEISALAEMNDAPIGRQRLQRMLELKPSTELPPILESLRAFVAPHAAPLWQMWQDDAERGCKSYVGNLSPTLLFDR